MDLRFVMVKPLRAGNVGSAVRAVAQMGAGRVVVVASDDVPHRESVLTDPRALEMADDAAGELHALHVCRDMEEAIDGCFLTVGFTARRRLRKEPRLIDLQDALPVLRQAALHGPVALLFGPENRGLSNAELDRCNMLVRIESEEPYPVLNISASVLLVAREMSRALAAARRDRNDDGTPLAPLADISAAADAMRQLLEKIQLQPPSRTHQGFVTLRTALMRMGLTDPECRGLRDSLDQLLEALDRRASPAPAPRDFPHQE